MGEARRRGTYEERVLQGVARRMEWERQRAEERERLRIERRRIASERQKLLSPQERKEAVLAVGDAHVNSALLAMMLAASAPRLAAPVYAIKRREP